MLRPPTYLPQCVLPLRQQRIVLEIFELLKEEERRAVSVTSYFRNRKTLGIEYPSTAHASKTSGNLDAQPRSGQPLTRGGRPPILQGRPNLGIQSDKSQYARHMANADPQNLEQKYEARDHPEAYNEDEGQTGARKDGTIKWEHGHQEN